MWTEAEEAGSLEEGFVFIHKVGHVWLCVRRMGLLSGSYNIEL